MTQQFKELRLDRVSRHFGHPGGAQVAALHELTLTIRRGEFICLLGPSGCGKTTALNCIAGLLPVTGGTISLDERRIDLLPPEKRGFGMVFQNYALFPHMTVRRNVAFGLMMRSTPADEIRTRVARAFQLVQLAGHEDKLPGQLSGGQQQRVAIARAIVIEPPLLLMDEPLSNLDAKLRLEMRAEIRRIHRELDRTTIYVTHDQDEALSLADRIVVMKDGLVQQVAGPEEVYAQPANLHVARFMGYRNVIALKVGARNGERVTLEGAGPGVEGFGLEGTARQELGGPHASVAIRPEDLSIGQGANVIAGKVENVEYGGRDSLIDVRVGSVLLHARSAERVKVGDDVKLTVAPQRVLVYPAESA
jgi:putative spermidine/putrescine transport system ATP-binding protein